MLKNKRFLPFIPEKPFYIETFFLLTIVSLLLCFPEKTFSQTSNSPLGWVKYSCQKIEGWTCDPDNFAEALNFHVYVDENFLLESEADLPADEGVRAACGGVTNQHGFSLALPDHLKDGKIHEIKIFGLNLSTGQNTQLNSVTGQNKFGPCYNKDHFVSNLKDPGFTLNNWWDWKNKETCYFNNPEIFLPSGEKPLWELIIENVDGTFCQSNAMKAEFSETNNQQNVTITLDNSQNSQNCASARNYVGIQPHWIQGHTVLNSLKTNNIASVLVKAKVKLNSLYVCADTTCPKCSNLPEGSWATLFIGIPVYDAKNQNQIWLEIILAYTEKSDFESNPNYLWDRCRPGPQGECLKRILVSSSAFDQKLLQIGEEKFYELEIPIEKFKSFNWGMEIDWENSYWGNLYVGSEISGKNAKIQFTVSSIDFLYIPSANRNCLDGAKKTCGIPGKSGWGEQSCLNNSWGDCQPYPNYKQGDLNHDNAINNLDIKTLFSKYSRRNFEADLLPDEIINGLDFSKICQLVNQTK